MLADHNEQPRETCATAGSQYVVRRVTSALADDFGISPDSIAEIPHLIERSASRLVLRLAAAGHYGYLLDQVVHGDWLRAVRARPARADATGEGVAVGAALLAEEPLAAVRAFVDGVLAAGPGGRRGHRDRLVLVAAAERGLAAAVCAVSLPPVGGERPLAGRAGDRPGIVPRRGSGHGVPSPARSLLARARWARIR